MARTRSNEAMEPNAERSVRAQERERTVTMPRRPYAQCSSFVSCGSSTSTLSIIVVSQRVISPTYSGSSVRRPGRISHTGNERLRSTLYMCALSAKRTNKALLGFVQRLKAAGKPPKVILVAVARKLLVYAHAVIRTQKPFDPFPDAPENA